MTSFDETEEDFSNRQALMAKAKWRKFMHREGSTSQATRGKEA